MNRTKSSPDHVPGVLADDECPCQSGLLVLRDYWESVLRGEAGLGQEKD